MSSEKARLFVISGPSGTGKSTLIRDFLKEDAASCFSVSYTTRSKRDGETEGRDYYFVDTETFQKMIKEGRFLEWENVHGYFYGTPKAEISKRLSEGIDVILDIDVKGALSVKKQCPQSILIFIDTPSTEELMKRLCLRGEKEIEKRMKRVRDEVAQKPLFTYVVINDTIPRASNEFRSIIEDTRRQYHG
jgi:guanylate kinase